MKSYFTILILSLLFLPACGPLCVYNFTTQEDDIIYYKGREILSKRSEDVIITLNFEDQVNDEMIFNLSVTNYSDTSIFFDPSKIYMEILKEYARVLPENEIVKLCAIDPEVRVKTLRKEIHSAKSNEEINQTFNLIAEVVELGRDVSEIGKKKTQEEINPESAKGTKKNQRRAKEEYYYHKNMSVLINNWEYWANAAFRKSTIFPGESMTGFVHLPLFEETREFRITIPVNKTAFTFLYKSNPIRNQNI